MINRRKFILGLASGTAGAWIGRTWARRAAVAGAGGVSPLQADDDFRRLEARHARAWFETLTSEVFGGLW